MISVILVKSGRTEYEAAGRLEGNLDIPLDEAGLMKARQAADQLAGIEAGAVYSGTGQACRATAECVAEVLGRRVQLAREFDEVSLGLWQGLLEGDVQRRHPKAFKQWKDEPDVVCPPKGETFRAGLDRAVGHMARFARKMGGSAVVVVLPRLLYGVVKCHLLNVPLGQAWAFSRDSTQWERFEVDERTLGES